MNQEEIIKKTREYIQSKMDGDGTGHDWWHIYRVCETAKEIGKKEKADLFVVELAALLHEIGDWKTAEAGNYDFIQTWLSELGVDQQIIDHIENIVKNVSFRGINLGCQVDTLEGKVVQDADRLDAIGAIGIARCFTYGGSRGRVLYDPSVKPDPENYHKKVSEDSLSHFHEKLFLIKDLMNTSVGMDMAIERDKFLREFFDRFMDEWEGKR